MLRCCGCPTSLAGWGVRGRWLWGVESGAGPQPARADSPNTGRVEGGAAGAAADLQRRLPPRAPRQLAPPLDRGPARRPASESLRPASESLGPHSCRLADAMMLYGAQRRAGARGCALGRRAKYRNAGVHSAAAVELGALRRAAAPMSRAGTLAAAPA